MSELLPPGGPTLARSRLRLGIMAASSCHVGPESTCHIMCQCQRPGWAGSRARRLLESGLRPGPAGSSFGPAGRARVGRRPTARRGVARGTPRFGPGDSDSCRRRPGGSGDSEPKRPRARPRVGRAGGARPACLCVFEMPGSFGGPPARPGRAGPKFVLNEQLPLAIAQDCGYTQFRGLDL